jgi:SAM-dependent methyltransferase
MSETASSQADWGNRNRLIAAEKWKAKSAAMGQPVTDALVEYARPQPGMRVLDLASGSGEPAISLATAVGEHGHVTALDVSADLLRVAAERAQAKGLRNFSTQQADAQSLPFPDDSFDLGTSRFGVMFFRDPCLAMKELRRVLHPKARACLLVWGSFEQPYWQTMMGVVHRHISGPLLPPGAGDPCRFAERGSLSDVLRRAGFSGVEEEERTLPWDWPGPVGEIWEQVRTTAAAFRPLLDRVPAGMWPKINDDVHAELRKYFDGEKVELGARVIFAAGTK